MAAWEAQGSPGGGEQHGEFAGRQSKTLKETLWGTFRETLGFPTCLHNVSHNVRIASLAMLVEIFYNVPHLPSGAPAYALPHLGPDWDR